MHFVRFAIMLVLILSLSATAFAYVGPGAGLSVIGSLLAFFAAIIVGIFGFLWFPIRRFLRKRKMAAEQRATEMAIDSDGPLDDPASEKIKPSEAKRD